MSTQTGRPPLAGVARGICEITLETGDLGGLERFDCDAFDCEVAPASRKSAGNVVEVWDFFEHGEGARDGVRALI